jgi:hypothetical protein
MTGRPADVESASRAILSLLSRRDDEKTICPSEAARMLSGDSDFRAYMPVVRDAARALVERGEIEVLQRGRAVDLEAARGPLRLRTARRASREA